MISSEFRVAECMALVLHVSVHCACKPDDISHLQGWTWTRQIRSTTTSTVIHSVNHAGKCHQPMHHLHAASCVTKTAPAAHLDVADVVAVPERLEDEVGEAQHGEILDELFSQVVVDSENLILVEHL